ncbi:hypothetical protein ACQ7HM_20910 [Williamsia sp. MIQD14]|uniref:hypothetical protein n=1 Tax=Williamsia sp. MIQD14 TaxID=3425703 RepID=UPI003DA0218D
MTTRNGPQIFRFIAFVAAITVGVYIAADTSNILLAAGVGLAIFLAVHAASWTLFTYLPRRRGTDPTPR